MVQLNLEEVGPMMSVDRMQRAAVDQGVNLPIEVCRFLVAVGNGGYLRESLYIFTDEPACADFEVRAVCGFNHQLPELSIVPTIAAFRADDVLPPGVTPVITDSCGTFLCWSTLPVCGCNIVHWSAFDGEPELLVPIARDFDDLLSRLETDLR